MTSENVNDKLKFVKDLDLLVTQLNPQDFPSLFPVLENIVKFNKVQERLQHRIEFTKQLPKILNHVQNIKTSEFSEVLPRVLEPLFASGVDVLSLLLKVFSQIVESLPDETRKNWLVTTLLRILHENEDSEKKIISVKMLGKTVFFLSSEICESFLLPEFFSMILGSSLEKCLSLELLPELYMKILTVENKEKMISSFLELCKDQDNEVKLASLQMFSRLFEICEDSLVIQKLQPCFRDFFKDPNEKVRNFACLQLGPLIHASKAPFPHFLLELFLKLAKTVPVNKELSYHCAFYFPAVLEKVGKESWNLLGETFLSLARGSDAASKKSCASSIHHIFSIVQESPDLFLVLKDFLTEKTFRLSVLPNLPKIFKTLTKFQKLEIIDSLKILSKDKTFRIRVQVASIHSNLSSDLGPYESYIHLWPLSKALCLDPVGQVRIEAMSGIGFISALIMSEIPDFSNEIIKDLKKFGRSAKSMHRLVFASACFQLVDLVEFEAAFGDDFIALAKDPVANVRILCAKALSKVKSLRRFWVELREALKTDDDLDVRREINGSAFGCCERVSAFDSQMVVKAPAVRNKALDVGVEEIWEFSAMENCFEYLCLDFRPLHDGSVRAVD
jgi:serine/threonine-protein phosphatase 4 regulatory subunit 1